MFRNPKTMEIIRCVIFEEVEKYQVEIKEPAFGEEDTATVVLAPRTRGP